MSPRLLILGAGVYQLPLVQTARRLGCTVLATSHLEHDPALRVADKGFGVSILDFEGLERLCRAERITRALTAASDLATLAVGWLNERFGWPGLTASQARRASDKRAFVRLLHQLGLPCPQSFFVESAAGREEALGRVQAYPVVMKPRFGSGSRGVRVCRGADEVRASHQTVLESSLLEEGYVLQQFLEGVEHGAECLIEDGRIVFLALTHKYYNDRRVPLGHCVPFACPPTLTASVRRQVERIAAALGVSTSPVNIDLIVTPEGVPHVIDVSFRLGGNLLPQLMNRAYGIDSYERVVRHSLGSVLGGRPAQQDAKGCYGSVIFGGVRNGVLTDTLMAALRRLFEESTRVIDLVFDIQHGEAFRAFDQSSHRFGHALFGVDDRAAYERVLDAQQAILRDEVGP